MKSKSVSTGENSVATKSATVEQDLSESSGVRSS